MIFSQMLDIASDWQTKVTSAVEKILVPILVIACSIGMVWAIVVGIKMIKADDKSKRDEAKATLINIAISIVATAVLIGLFYALMNWLEGDGKNGGVTSDDFGNLFTPENQSGPSGSGQMIGNTLSLVKQCVSMAIFKF